MEPLNDLVGILATLVDSRGMVLVPDFYAEVEEVGGRECWLFWVVCVICGWSWGWCFHICTYTHVSTQPTLSLHAWIHPNHPPGVARGAGPVRRHEPQHRELQGLPWGQGCVDSLAALAFVHSHGCTHAFDHPLSKPHQPHQPTHIPTTIHQPFIRTPPQQQG